MKPLSFRRRQFFTLIALAVFPLTLALGFALPYARNEIIQRTITQLQTVADLKTVQVQQWLDQGREVARMVSNLREFQDDLFSLIASADPGVRTQAQTDIQHTLYTLTDVYLYIRSISLLHPTGGQIMLSTDPTLIGRERRREPDFYVGQRFLYISSVTYSIGREGPVLNVSAPVQSTTGELLAVVTVEMDLSDLQAALASRAGLGETGRSYLVDSYGFYVTLPPQVAGGPLHAIAKSEGVSRTLKGKNGSDIYQDPNGIRVLGVYRWLTEGNLGLLVEIEVSEVAAHIDRVLLFAILTALVLIVISGVIAGYLGNRLITPLTQIAAAAAALRSGDLNRRAPTLNTQDEISQLAQTFNQMADSLQNSHRGLEHLIAQRTAELNREKERAQVTLHSIGDAVITTDAKGMVEYMNPTAEQLTGWTLIQAQGQPLEYVFNIINEKTRLIAANPVVRCLKTNDSIDLTDNIVLLSRSGQEYAIQESAAPIQSPHGELLGVVLVFRDVSAARQMTHQLSYQASHDILTGLVNRLEFEHRANNALTSAKQQNSHHALCFLDLDQFKIVNDTAGHRAGDELLKQVAGLLLNSVRQRDTLARLGGDEFGLLLENCPISKAIEIAETLVATIQDFRFIWEERTFRIGVSIGLTPIAAQIDNTAQLMSQADVACYTAKDLGRNRVHVYQNESGEPARRHSEILRAAELSDALNDNRFQLYYQPIVGLGATDKEIRHYEFLLRLVDSNGETVMPGNFIPAAERYGFMTSIDRWVIRTVFEQYYDLFALHPEVIVAINLSGNSLSDETLLDFVREEFYNSGAPPERICFEITETAAINNLAQATQFIAAMKEKGCRFALDDFGSGLSSFNYLKHLPVDYLKIDGGFIQNLVEDPIDLAMVETINQVGHILGIYTIAEFANSPAIVERLREIGVDYAQGYALGMPRPLTEFRKSNIVQLAQQHRA